MDWDVILTGLATQLTTIFNDAVPAIWPVFALFLGVSIVVWLLGKFGISR